MEGGTMSILPRPLLHDAPAEHPDADGSGFGPGQELLTVEQTAEILALASRSEPATGR
jgi:hypothetical protein